MMLKLRCPACGNRLHASEAVLGKTVLCPSCGGVFPVNIPAAEPKPAVASEVPPPVTASSRLRPPTPPVEMRRPARRPEPPPHPAPRPAPAPSPVYAPQPERPEPHRPASRARQASRPAHQGLPAWAFAIIGCAASVGVISFLVLIRSLAGPRAGPVEADRTAAATGQPALPDLAPAPAPSGGAALSTAQIVARCEPSVALVKGKVSSGTGFLVRRNLVATNAHVIDDEFLLDLEIRFPSAPAGYQGPLQAELLYEDPKRDLALLAIQSGLPALEVAPSYRFLKGEDVLVIGNPGLGDEVVMENAVSRGVMSSKTAIEGQDFLQMGIAINPGNSGGPVFDSTGRVIGVATLKASKAESMGFCIPVEDLHAALNRLDSQPGSARATVASRHRSGAAFKMLTTAGALYTLGSYLRAASASGADPRAAEVGQSLAEALTHLDKQFSQVDRHLAEIRSDRALADTTRRSYDDLASNYRAIRDLYDHPIQPPVQYVARARDLAGQHLRLVRALQGDLGIQVPQELMAILEKAPRQEETQGVLVQVVPAPVQPRLRPRRGPGMQPSMPIGPRFGPGGFNPAQDAQARAQDMQRRMQQMQRDMQNRMHGMQPRFGP
jgi:S1-C subfamily serine protease